MYHRGACINHFVCSL